MRLRRLPAALLCTLLALLSAPVLATAADGFPDAMIADPSATGPYGQVSQEFSYATAAAAGIPDTSGGTGADAGRIVVGTDTTRLAARLAGNVHVPTGATGTERFPVLVLLHGNHSTCQSRLSELGPIIDPLTLAARYANGTCTTVPGLVDQILGIDAARSYQGYDYLATTLATQGYIVVSLDVNDITAWGSNAARAGYLGRVQLMSKALDMVSGWDAHAGPGAVGDLVRGRVDTDRVGVMGHSRGGEGVDLFAAYNADRPATAEAAAAFKLDYETDEALRKDNPDFGPRYGLKAVFSLAPVDGQGGFRPEFDGVAFATALPACDGDVFNLQGAPVFERNRRAISRSGHPAIQFVVQGANHNDFNTVWTNDDANFLGFGDPGCSFQALPTRLSKAEVRRVGTTMIGGFLRRYVGDETQFGPIMTGRGVTASTCPDEDPDGAGTPLGVTCRNVLQTSYVAPAPARRTLLDPTGTSATPPAATAEGDPVSYAGFAAASVCRPVADSSGSTTGCGGAPNRSPTPQLSLGWEAPASLSVALGAGHRDVSGFGTLSFRAGVNPQASPSAEQVVLVTLTDGAGGTATARSADWSSALQPAPGTTDRRQLLSGVRIPLTAFPGVDLTDVRTVRLGFGETAGNASGEVQLTELAFQEPAPVVVPEPDPDPSTPTTPAAPTTPADPSASATPAVPGGTGTGGAAGTGTGGAGGTGSAGGVPARASALALAARTPASRALRLAAGRTGIPLRVRCSATCRVTVTVTLSAKVARRLGLRSRTVRRVVVALRAERTRAVALRLPASVATKLRTVRGARVSVRLRATGATGTRTLSRSVRLR